MTEQEASGADDEPWAAPRHGVRAKGLAGVGALAAVAAVAATVVLVAGATSPSTSPIPPLLPVVTVPDGNLSAEPHGKRPDTVHPEDLERLEAAVLPLNAVPHASVIDPGTWLAADGRRPGPLMAVADCRRISSDFQVMTFQRVWAGDMPGDPLLNEGYVTVGHVVARQVSVESDPSEELVWGAVPICGDDQDSDDEHTVGQINSTWAIGGALPPGLDAGWVYCESVRFDGEACTGYLARGDLVSVLTVSIRKRSAEPTRALFDRLVTDAAARLMAA